MLSSVFKPFVDQSPISVMARGMLERVLNPRQMDEWFDITSKEQYAKELLFSTIFDLMCQVVQGSQPSVHAAFQASKKDIAVSISSVYNKLNGIEPETSAELVRYTAGKVEPIISKLLGKKRKPFLEGKRIKLLDGNCIEKSHHREKHVSGYYVANEIKGVYQGMMIVVSNKYWFIFRDMPAGDLVRLLKKLAKKVKLQKYQKHPRGPKKPQPSTQV